MERKHFGELVAMKIARRIWAVLIVLLPCAVVTAGQINLHRGAKPKQYVALVGTYTSKTQSKGIYAIRFDAATGKLTSDGLVAEAVDPSFLAVHPNGKYIYAVNEMPEFEGQKSGAVSAYSLDRASNKLTLLNQVASRGAGPCYIALDKTGKFILVANYDGGSVAVFPVEDDGRLGAATGFAQHSGSGPTKDRQETAHAHWIETSADNRFAVVADLGLDEVLVYRFDAATGKLSANDPAFVKLSGGAGPRHFAFHPNNKFAYSLNEIQSTVTAFQYDQQAGTLAPVQTVPTLPAEFTAPNDTAELVIHPNGKFLYASNRGHNSIAIFAVDPNVGTLTPLGTASTQGKTPRNFAIDPSGKFLIVANQDSNNLTVFRIDGKTGELQFTHQTLEVPTPVDIAFLDAR